MEESQVCRQMVARLQATVKEAAASSEGRRLESTNQKGANEVSFCKVLSHTATLDGWVKC